MDLSAPGFWVRGLTGVLVMQVLAYLILCLLVGYLGRKRFLGFWGFAFISLILTPLFGGALLLLTRVTKEKRLN